MALKQVIQEGLDSGVSNKTVGEIWEEAEQRFKINVAKFHLTNRAVTDLSDIADFTIQNFGIEQARFYRDGFNNCFEILAENPQLGRSAADLAPNLRRYEHRIDYFDELPQYVMV